MSEIKYGLISRTDSQTIEKTLDLIMGNNVPHLINITEVGCYAGETSNGMRGYLESKGWEGYFTGIDNNKDGETIRLPYDRLLIGNSNEVYHKVDDNSQHLIFVDGCHCFAHVVSDFFCYATKVKVGGYLCFHDAGRHIQQFKDFQHGDEKNPDAYISVRKALSHIRMFDQWGSANRDLSVIKGYSGNRVFGWELIFDEADPQNEAGGICCFRKLY